MDRTIAWLERHHIDLGSIVGSFALVASTSGESTLVAADPCAARSIVFQAKGRRLLFASEIHLLLRLLPTRPAPSPGNRPMAPAEAGEPLVEPPPAGGGRNETSSRAGSRSGSACGPARLGMLAS